MITIRSLGQDDWRRWRELRLAALTEAPGAFHTVLADWAGAREADWRDRLSSVTANFLISWDGAPAGIVSAHLVDSDSARLMSLWIAPHTRGHGVGDAAVRHVLDWARARGLGTVTLGVTAGNSPAIALYRRNGFVDVGLDPDHLDDRLMVARIGS